MIDAVDGWSHITQKYMEERTAYDHEYPFHVPVMDFSKEVADTMTEWCEENCRERFVVCPNVGGATTFFHRRAWFISEHDALLFKLRWL